MSSRRQKLRGGKKRWKFLEEEWKKRIEERNKPTTKQPDDREDLLKDLENLKGGEQK